MNIWTCKRSCFSLLFVCALPACTEIGFTLPTFDLGLSGGEFRRNVALVSAEMAQGQIKLVPPDGYCIDKRALRQDFAVLARCDSLGGRGGAQDAALGLITVAITPEAGDVVLSEFVDLLVPAEAEHLAEFNSEGLSLVQVLGDVPPGADARHWRGVTRASGQLVSLAAFAPQGDEATPEDGRERLRELAARTRAASEELSAQPSPPTQSAAVEAGLPGLLRGLFNRKPSNE
ncbi:MAG: hypothetical protein AAF754_15850 [Pseudomonadota bacterium]